jgi:hypothetical protein
MSNRTALALFFVLAVAFTGLLGWLMGWGKVLLP